MILNSACMLSKHNWMISGKQFKGLIVLEQLSDCNLITTRQVAGRNLGLRIRKGYENSVG